MLQTIKKRKFHSSITNFFAPSAKESRNDEKTLSKVSPTSSASVVDLTEEEEQEEGSLPAPVILPSTLTRPSPFKRFECFQTEGIEEKRDKGEEEEDRQREEEKDISRTGKHCFLASSTARRRDIKEEILHIRAFPCKRPAFKDQVVLNKAGVFVLDEENNAVAIEYDFFSSATLQDYLRHAADVARASGKSAFNSTKPRKEVCYTVDGQPFRYSRILHPTTRYPAHVKSLLPAFQNYIDRVFPQTPFRKISGALDIIYSPEFERGGSAGSHSDIEMDWGLVLIFSLGQTRWFRIRRKRSDGQYYNVEMRHNSVILMHGKTFQDLYTHQVDKLSKQEDVYYRLSLNIRYLTGENNAQEL